MRRSFKREVRDYVIVERYKRKPWKEIVAGVRDKFGIEPPSIRIMQSWFHAYQGATADPTGVKYVSQVIQDAADEAKPLAQAQMMSWVFPLWSYIQEHHNMPVFKAGLVAMWHFYASQIGRENLDDSYSAYVDLRDSLPSQPLPWPSPGWTEETIISQEAKERR